jgi:hypothetical protein
MKVSASNSKLGRTYLLDAYEEDDCFAIPLFLKKTLASITIPWKYGFGLTWRAWINGW